MKIVPERREDYIGHKGLFEFLKAFLHRSANVREKAVTERLHYNGLGAGPSQESARAKLRFFRPLRVGTEDHPVKLDSVRTLNQTEHRAPTPNLNIIAVCAQT